MEAMFLSALEYDGMLDRDSTVTEAHQETFRWIFLEDAVHALRWTNFGDWLRSPDQLYWITGKPGSGKSTLMKFVSQSPPDRGPTGSSDSNYTPEEPEARCTEYLRQWAGGQASYCCFLLFLGRWLQATAHEGRALPYAVASDSVNASGVTTSHIANSMGGLVSIRPWP